MPDFNINDFIKNIPKSISVEKAKGISARVQFSLSGEGGGEWGLVLDDGKVTVEETTLRKPDLELKADAAIAGKVFSGELDPMKAYMGGKLKIIGNMGLALKLLALLR